MANKWQVIADTIFEGEGGCVDLGVHAAAANLGALAKDDIRGGLATGIGHDNIGLQKKKKARHQSASNRVGH